MTKPNKSNDMRNQLRSLMSQHTAMAKPPAQATISAPIPAPTVPAIVDKAREQNIKITPLTPKARPFERCTIRLTGNDLATVDQLILSTHQHSGERITTTDLFRIALARLAKGSPVSTVEIQSLRATDRRRNRE